MNLDQLEVLVTVVEQGGFRAAAEHLNRSQPALSTAIKNLEEEFNILIFDRSRYRPRLTEQGVAFLSVAKSTLESARYTSRVGKELGQAKAETKLKISVDPLISPEVIEIIAQECSRPTLPVHLIIDKSILSGSYQPLLNGEIDLAVAPSPKDVVGLEGIFLEEVTLMGAISKKLLQEKRKPTAEFLQSSPQILVYDKSFDELPDELLPKNLTADRGQKIFVPDHSSKFKLIEAGIGWGRLSQKEISAHRELVSIEKNICRPIHLELCLLRPQRRAIGPIARAIWKAFENKKR